MCRILEPPDIILKVPQICFYNIFRFFMFHIASLNSFHLPFFNNFGVLTEPLDHDVLYFNLYLFGFVHKPTYAKQNWRNMCILVPELVNFCYQIGGKKIKLRLFFFVAALTNPNFFQRLHCLQNHFIWNCHILYE